MTLYVGDVSSHQGDNIDGIVADNNAVIVKVTEGNYYVNPNWQTQAQKVLNAGKKLGLYHFINAGVDNNTQAQYFLDTIGGYANQAGVALMLDFENMSNRTQYPTLTGNEPKAIADYIDAKTGKTTWLYIGYADIQSGYTWDDMKDRPLWVADYPSNDGSPYSQELQEWEDTHHFNVLKFWSTVTMWQYDSVPYDRSVFYGDKGTWDKLAGGTGNESQPSDNQVTFRSEPETSAIDKFIGVANKFVLAGPFVIDTCQLVNGVYQVKSEELCADPFDWSDNGIPTKLLDDLDDMDGRSFEDGHRVAFKKEYQRGTIDKYDREANAIGIDFLDGNGIIWFDADKFWNHE
ncbi:4-beta-N-acetylmuramidase) [Fructobacillus fructosus]|uniref:GH25 family (Acm) n=1 Tax=Fructobacillus fructosus TaxID=1631 RepID=A0ABM9MMF0_9LACO|nr:4-beta-N-acetylmuramidase) [Fructobacillus fructosus]